MFKEKKTCYICNCEIDSDMGYNVFKHNSIVADKNELDKWMCMVKAYICPHCMADMKEYIVNKLISEK